jgi:hypothetical protein
VYQYARKLHTACLSNYEKVVGRLAQPAPKIICVDDATAKCTPEQDRNAQYGILVAEAKIKYRAEVQCVGRDFCSSHAIVYGLYAVQGTCYCKGGVQRRYQKQRKEIL